MMIMQIKMCMQLCTRRRIVTVQRSIGDRTFAYSIYLRKIVFSNCVMTVFSVHSVDFVRAIFDVICAPLYRTAVVEAESKADKKHTFRIQTQNKGIYSPVRIIFLSFERH